MNVIRAKDERCVAITLTEEEAEHLASVLLWGAEWDERKLGNVAEKLYFALKGVGILGAGGTP